MPPSLPHARRRHLTVLLVFCTSVLLLGALSWHFEQRQLQAQRATLMAVASKQALSIEGRLQRLLSSAYLLAAMVRANPSDLSEFESIASQILPMYPGVAALSLSPGGVIQHVVPRAGNEALLNFDQFADPRQGPDARRARDTGELTLAGPIDLLQGGFGVVGRLPIFLPTTEGQPPAFWGLANVAIRFPQALSNSRLDGLVELGYDYELWRTLPDGTRQRIAASWAETAPSPLMRPVHKTVRVPSNEWTLSIAPRGGWGQPHAFALYILLSVLLSALLALLVKQVLEQRVRGMWLEQEVQARLIDVNAIRQDLQATLSALPDLLFDIDAHGLIYHVHTQHPADLLQPAERLVGQYLHDVLPPDALAVVRLALEQAGQVGRSTGLQYTLPLPQGPQWFELSVSAKSDATQTALAGATPRFIVLARNITPRKHAEDQYALAARFFMGSSEGFAITDAQQRIIQVNPAFTTITGYSADDVRGHTPRLLSSGRHGPEFYAAMWADMERLGHWEGEIWNQRRNGEIYPEWLSISRVQNAQGETTNYVAIFSDISRRREQEERICHLAHYDPLTGLANRALLRQRVQHDLSLARRRDTPLSLLFIDLDHFKHINDSLGHQAGDQLLKQVAQRIAAAVREQDTVSRLGGDEFVAVLPDSGAAGAERLATELLLRLSAPYHVEGQELTVTPSIGLAVFPDDGADFEALYRCADTAMYRAKQAGRHRYAFFTPEMQAQSQRRLALENALRRAIERNELSVHYQPQVSLTEQQVVGVEALLRWQHPEWGAIAPSEFIPIAESSGQIVAIGTWVLRQACEQAQRWRQQGGPELVVAVNLSAVQFRQAQLIEQVEKILQETGLPAHCLELELTESTTAIDPEGAAATLQGLCALGVRLSIDDFGTGYSSLSQLKRFRVHKLKIDRSFVADAPHDAEDASIVETIIHMAHSMGLKTIAEGVETPAQRDFLRLRGCDEMQGYLLARPLPANDFEAWWRGARSPAP